MERTAPCLVKLVEKAGKVGNVVFSITYLLQSFSYQFGKWEKIRPSEGPD